MLHLSREEVSVGMWACWASPLDFSVGVFAVDGVLFGRRCDGIGTLFLVLVSFLGVFRTARTHVVCVCGPHGRHPKMIQRTRQTAVNKSGIHARR
jgi:hypothetical protein